MDAPQREIGAILAQLNKIILGKDSQIQLCLTCLWHAAIC